MSAEKENIMPKAKKWKSTHCDSSNSMSLMVYTRATDDVTADGFDTTLLDDLLNLYIQIWSYTDQETSK